MNWIVSKATGYQSAGEECHSNVLAFLEKHYIKEPSFSFLRGERSRTHNILYNRVYVGKGLMDGKEVGFVLSANEDIPSGVHGALLSDPLIFSRAKMQLEVGA